MGPLYIFPSPHVSRRSVCVRALIHHLLGSLWVLCRRIATYPYEVLTFSAALVWSGCQPGRARVWGQGLTSDIIIAAGALTHSQRKSSTDAQGESYILESRVS